MTSKNAQCSTREVDLSPLDLPQNRSLETVPLAWFGSVTHITILSVFTCVMDVRYQTIQSFVTRFVHFVIDRASLFTDE